MITEEDKAESDVSASDSGGGGSNMETFNPAGDRTAALTLSAGPAKSIQAIDKTSVHRICSGQVVLSLATAVKELVENSLDAGATCVEVRLKDYGSELIEVLDNGSGVEEKNFQALTLKHHTSKLQDFSDLTRGNVDTFGFRGEALSSLCALSKMSITTRHESVTVGHRLEFDHHGKMQQQQLCARQKGTTVSLQDLFSTLPVRHKEFSRNVKKEFVKMVQVLSAYCIISRGVRISCTNLVGKGKKNIVVNTGANDTMKENIINVFGPKQMQTVLEFTQTLPAEDVCSDYNIKPPECEEQQVFKLSGYVSNSEHGHGRSSADRQFYFINQRPCDFAKVSRLVNEVYHQFNRHQYPFVVLDVSLSKESVDVNVTPDKRQIFIQHEKLLLATVKASLLKMFEPRSCLVPMTPAHSLQGSQPGSLSAVFSRRSPQKSPLKKHQSCSSLPERKPATFTLSKLKRSFSSAFAREQPPSMTGSDGVDRRQRCMDSFLVPHEASAGIASTAVVTPEPPPKASVNSATVGLDSGLSVDEGSDVHSRAPSDVDSLACVNSAAHAPVAPGELSSSSRAEESSSVRFESRSGKSMLQMPDNVCTGEYTQATSGRQTSASPKAHSGETKYVASAEDACTPPPESNMDSLEELHLTYTEFDSPGNDLTKKTVTVPFSLDCLRREHHGKNPSGKLPEGFCRSFRAKINPEDNLSAENELKKEISKDMFAEMEILGQFNLGFIIAKLGADLFIIDQHATDEKYNFEMLQRDTVIQSQKLICPQNLELTAVNESILIDNLGIFEKNGFQFAIDEEGVPTQRVKLVSKPVSRNWEFGKEDIEELIFMLSDTPGVMCRPTRIRQMFASRACRKAIMIGTALSHREMKKLVVRMGKIEQPWNCPHGRPTMRHLINMNMLAD